jgi:hypothetical protein
MEFFNSLTLDLKMLVVAIAGCALLALFSGNQKAEKRYMVVFALLAAVGVYRFTQVGDDLAPPSAAASSAPLATTAPPAHKPLVSTSAK